MKHLQLSVVVIALILSSCNGTDKHPELTKNKADSVKLAKHETKVASTQPATENTNKEDVEEIRNLIRSVLKLSSSKDAVDLYTELTDPKDSTVVGLDMQKHKASIEKLKAVGFFSEEFISNYDQIILTLDKKIRNKEFTKWTTGELPSFNFANDVDPWCACQDVPYDSPNPMGLVDVEVIKLDNESGELNWFWGGLKPGMDPGWKDVKYKFNVQKVAGEWKVSYMQGFDFKESIKGI